MMKTRFIGRLTGYIFAALFLCVLSVSFFAYVFESVSIGAPAKIIILIVFAACMCLYTAFVIARHVGVAITRFLKEIDEISDYLKDASAKMREKADELDKNAILLIKRINSANCQGDTGASLPTVPFNE